MSRMVAITLTAAALLAARPALACGGFFCAQTPINQAGEHIAFAVSDHHVKAVVQISYQGDAMKFAWVVPLPAEPTLSIGSPALFTFLDQRTQPTFQLDYSDNSCQSVFPGLAAPKAASAEDNTATGGGGVTVLSHAEVGPYDAAVLTATNSSALLQWLSDNSYDLTPAADNALVPYIGSGYYFVALRLQQDKGVGDLRPITLDFDGDTPCIPIRLTAIAAQPNMPITAYVLASARAVPTNYRHVVLNESRIDWLNFGANYTAIATAAVNEAGGHAFLTEYAGTVRSATASARLYDGSLHPDRLAQLSDPVDFVLELQAENFPQAGLLDMLEHYVPEPAALVAQGVSEQQFYSQIGSYREAIANDPNRAPFDATAFAHELDQSVVQPLVDAQAMLDQNHYLTRLFTTMSPNAMTLDPEFAFNSGLPDVSNIHHASASCDLFDTNNVHITLPDGTSFDVTRAGGPISQGPAAARIEQLAATGAPKVIKDNSKAIDDALGQLAGCTCTSVDPSALLGLVGLLGALRRRRRSVS